MKAILTSVLLALSMSVFAEDEVEVTPEPEAKVEQSSAASRAWAKTKDRWEALKVSVENYFEEAEAEPKVTTELVTVEDSKEEEETQEEEEEPTLPAKD